MHIQFLYVADCPSHEAALLRLRTVLAEEGIDTHVAIIEVTSEAQAQQLRFVGSPTILIAGHDMDPPPDAARYGLACRAYQHTNGRISPLPEAERLRQAIRAARAAGKLSLGESTQEELER